MSKNRASALRGKIAPAPLHPEVSPQGKSILPQELDNGWAEGKTIDRIDSNGDYEPSNCQWADVKTQMNNVRSNIHLEYRGEEMTLAQFCEQTGANYDRARYFIFRKGLTVEEALRQMELNN